MCDLREKENELRAVGAREGKRERPRPALKQVNGRARGFDGGDGAGHEGDWARREEELLGVIEDQRAAFRADIEELEQQRTDDLADLWDEHWRRVNALRAEYDAAAPAEAKRQTKLAEELAEVLEELREKEDMIDELEEENKALQDSLRAAKKASRKGAAPATTPRARPADAEAAAPHEELLRELDMKMDAIRTLTDAVDAEKKRTQSAQQQSSALTAELATRVEQLRALEEANAALTESAEAKRVEEDIFQAAQAQLISSKDAEIRDLQRRADDAEARLVRVEKQMHDKQKKQAHLLQLVDTQRDHIQRLQSSSTRTASLRSLPSASPDCPDRWERDSRDTASVASSSRTSRSRPRGGGGGGRPLPSYPTSDVDSVTSVTSPPVDVRRRPPPAEDAELAAALRTTSPQPEPRARRDPGLYDAEASPSIEARSPLAALAHGGAPSRRLCAETRDEQSQGSSLRYRQAPASRHADPSQGSGYAQPYRALRSARSSVTSASEFASDVADNAQKAAAAAAGDDDAAPPSARELRDGVDDPLPSSDRLSSRASEYASSAVSSASRQRIPAASTAERNNRLEQLRAQVEDARAERLRLQSKRRTSEPDGRVQA